MATASNNPLEQRALVVAPTGKDAELAVAILHKAGLAAEACANIAEMCAEVQRGAAMLVIAQEALGDRSVVQLVHWVTHQPAWSDLPITILTSGGEETLRSQRAFEMFGPGANVSLLERPFRATTLISVVQTGLRSRLRQFEVRSLLAQRDELLASERVARSDAEAANRMKDEFLASLSHELRTPLNAILGWSQLLQSSGLPSDEGQRGLQVIERNAHVQAQLIEDLLDVSRIISGKLRLDSHPVNLAEVGEAALASVLPSAAAKQIRIERQMDPDAGTIVGDAARLQQIVWNLLSNAIKFTPHGGKVQIRLQRTGADVQISVSDTGAGIPAEFLPFVFDRFRQADGSTTRRHGGLGLGLSIVRQLTELHGGTVAVTSEGEGRGSTFVVRLPVSLPQNEGIPTRSNSRKRNGCKVNLNGLRVLVVDDDYDARDVLVRVLVSCEAEVVAAESADDALARLREFHPHLLISDIGMPIRDGYELIRHVRSEGINAKQLPAVALTAFARPEDRQRALLAGFQVHLTKPVNAAELTAVAASLAGRTGIDVDDADDALHA